MRLEALSIRASHQSWRNIDMPFQCPEVADDWAANDDDCFLWCVIWSRDSSQVLMLRRRYKHFPVGHLHWGEKNIPTCQASRFNCTPLQNPTVASSWSRYSTYWSSAFIMAIEQLWQKMNGDKAVTTKKCNELQMRCAIRNERWNRPRAFRDGGARQRLLALQSHLLLRTQQRTEDTSWTVIHIGGRGQGVLA